MAILSRFCRYCGVKLTPKTQTEDAYKNNHSVCSSCKNDSIKKRASKAELQKRIQTQPTKIDPHLFRMFGGHFDEN